jgi:molecular chaperone DnaJ
MPAVQTKDYYKLLGVSRTADAKAIQAAFRKLARKHHPDVNPGDKAAEDRFKEINQAKEVLLNPASRKLYDRYGEDWSRYRDAGFTGDEPKGAAPRPGSRASGAGQAADFEQWFSSAGDGAGPTFRSRTTDDAGGFTDFVSSIFGSGRRSERPTARNTKRRGEDLTVNVSISFDEAFSGTTRRLDIQAPEECPTCHGTGMVRQAPCPTCDGTGIVAKMKTVEVKIPAGVKTGSKVRVRGQGGPGFGGGAPGDVFLVVTVQPSDLFERDGVNLKTEVETPLYTAVLGGEVVAPTQRGRVALTIPPESQNGRVFRLKGQGMPAAKGAKEAAGDLLVRIKLTTPVNLTEKERELFRQLKELRS